MVRISNDTRRIFFVRFIFMWTYQRIRKENSIRAFQTFRRNIFDFVHLYTHIEYTFREIVLPPITA